MIETARELIVVDFKTARSRWSAGQVQDSADQLLLYGQLAQGLVPEKSLALRFAVLTKTKLPSLDCHAAKFNPRQLTRLAQLLQRVWAAIEADIYYPAPSPLNFPTCPYREPCRVWCG